MRLTPIEFRILLFLIKNTQAPLCREKIMSLVWGEEQKTMAIRGIDAHVSRLRDKLRDSHVIIHSVYQQGYILQEV